MRWTVPCDTPACRAKSRVDQWVRPAAGGFNVKATICARFRAVIVAGGGAGPFLQSRHAVVPRSAGASG